jgi:hypothetical protein
MIIDEAQTDNWISWTLTDPWLQLIITASLFNTLYTSSEHTLKSSWPLLITASNGGRSPFCGFPNCPRASTTGFSSNNSKLNRNSSPTDCHPPTDSAPLTDWTHFSLSALIIKSRHGPHRKHLYSLTLYGRLPSNDPCAVVCFAVVAQQRVYLPQ